MGVTAVPLACPACVNQEGVILPSSCLSLLPPSSATTSTSPSWCAAITCCLLLRLWLLGAIDVHQSAANAHTSPAYGRPPGLVVPGQLDEQGQHSGLVISAGFHTQIGWVLFIRKGGSADRSIVNSQHDFGKGSCHSTLQLNVLLL